MKRMRTAAVLFAALMLLTNSMGVLAAGKAAISNDKIEIAQYKGLKIKEYIRKEITDEEVEKNISEMVSLSSERISFSDRPGEPGDTAKLKLDCSVDGMPFEYLCYDETEILLPYADDLDMDSYDLLGQAALQTEGYNVGDKLSFDMAVPAGYTVFPEIAGKTAHWDVEILELVSYIQAEFNDAYVESQNIEGVTTVDQYRVYMKEELERNEDNIAKYTLRENALNALLAQVRLPQYPQEEIDAYLDEYRTSYQENAQYLNIPYEQYIEEYIGCSVEEFEKQILETAEQYVKEDLAIGAVANAEDLLVDEAYYAANADAYAQSYYYDSAAALEASFGKESAMASMERDRVLDFLVEASEQVDENTAYEAIDQAKEESARTGKLLYVTIGLAIALLVVLTALVVVVIKGRKR